MRRAVEGAVGVLLLFGLLVGARLVSAQGKRYPNPNKASGAASSGGGGVPANFSIEQPDLLATSATCAGTGATWNAQWSTPARSTAIRFAVLANASITDIRFFTSNPAAATNTGHVFDGGPGYSHSPMGTCTVASTGVGRYTCHFATPVAIVPGMTYQVTIWNNVGYTKLVGCSGNLNPNNSPGPHQTGPNFVMGYWGDYSTADIQPGGQAAEVYPITPLFTVP